MGLRRATVHGASASAPSLVVALVAAQTAWHSQAWIVYHPARLVLGHGAAPVKFLCAPERFHLAHAGILCDNAS